MSNNSQNFWTAGSFLVLGLILGLIITGPRLISEQTNGSQTAQEEPLKFVEVSNDDDPILGDVNALVTIVEFSDYQCYWCHYWWLNTYPQLKSTYIDTGKVKLVYRDRPISKHPQSQLAAEAAECVGDSGDELYFKMHDMIFSGEDVWSGKDNAKDIFIGYANTLGVEITSCLDSGVKTEEVANDYAASKTYGINGTPTFYINGKTVKGAQSFEYFQAVIEEELK